MHQRRCGIRAEGALWSRMGIYTREEPVGLIARFASGQHNIVTSRQRCTPYITTNQHVSRGNVNTLG